MLDLTHATFHSTVTRDDDVPVLVDYWAPWCAPCRLMTPVLEELAAELGDGIVIAKVNVDDEPELAGAAQIRAIPTMHLIQNGKLVDVLMGLQNKSQLRAALSRLAKAA